MNKMFFGQEFERIMKPKSLVPEVSSTDSLLTEIDRVVTPQSGIFEPAIQSESDRENAFIITPPRSGVCTVYILILYI